MSEQAGTGGGLVSLALLGLGLVIEDGPSGLLNALPIRRLVYMPGEMYIFKVMANV